MQFETLRLEIEGERARITLSRADAANRIGLRTVRELSEACERLRDADEIRVVLLLAQGEDFCAGWEEEVLARPDALPEDAFGPLAALPQPVIAAVQGRVVSAGLELALVCDVRLAAEGTTFALPETAMGLLPLAGGSQRLPRLTGPGVAAAMLLAGEELEMAAAYRAGLVSRVTPASRLREAAEMAAAAIAARGPIALRYGKEAVHRGLEMTLEQALRYETDLTVILQTTEDRAEGVRAFLERRPPSFKGR
jgi:enoyl-CoA hydratase